MTRVRFLKPDGTLVEVRADAPNDADVDGIGRANVADTFGLEQELAQLVYAADGAGRSSEGEKLSFRHGELCDVISGIQWSV